MRCRAATGAATRTLLLMLVLGLISAATARASSVVLTSTPPADTNQTSATFSFHASTGSASFQCALDAGSFAACTSPDTIASLAEGQHSFSVRTNGTGVSPATRYTWTVDLTPPVTQVTSHPPSLTNSQTATFTFSSPDSTASFRCSLNGAPPQPCTSPVVYTGLMDATRTLLIQAVDPAGNVDPEAQPITWTVDTTPPDTTLGNPGNVVGQDVVDFDFTSTEPGSTFQCSFDGAAFSGCTSPEAEDVPGSGARMFEVRAVDAAGNVDPTPAVYQWTSDLTPPKRPNVSIFAAPSVTHTRNIPVPTVQKNPGLGVTFTNTFAKLLKTPPFTLTTRLDAGWASDATAKSFDVTIDEFPQDSTGTDGQGDDLDYHKVYSDTKRTALKLHVYPGTTVCLKVDATDGVGNTSNTRLACTTVPSSFGPVQNPPHPVKDSKAWQGYYIHLRSHGYAYDNDIGDEFFFSPRHAALVAEHCSSCGRIEFYFKRYGRAHLYGLASVNLSGSSHGEFKLITVGLPVDRLEGYGMGLLLIKAVSGRPRIAGIGLSG